MRQRYPAHDTVFTGGRIPGNPRLGTSDNKQRKVFAVVPFDDDDTADDEFNEEDHPRGNPGNAGQFSKGGGGSGGSVKKVYHGTMQEHLDSIRKNGLTVSGNKRNFNPDLYEGERGKSVYVTDSLEGAKKWTDLMRMNAVMSGNPVPQTIILEADLPGDFDLKSDQGEGGGSWGVGGSYRATSNIPPQYIKNYRVVPGDGSLGEPKQFS